MQELIHLKPGGQTNVWATCSDNFDHENPASLAANTIASVVWIIAFCIAGYILFKYLLLRNKCE